jgi:hypothetical protein
MTSENETRLGGDPGALESGQPDNSAGVESVSRLREFLSAIHGENAAGFIEVRLIEDREDGQLVDRRFYPTHASLIANVPMLLAIAERDSAAVFYGVLRRAQRGKGGAADVLPGTAAWADSDFKDFDGGEAEARECLARFPLPSSITVRSGHGLHPYWLLREPLEPKQLSALCKRIAQVIRGDHAFDAARILRLPGSINRKDPAKPVPVEIESFEPTRVYNVSEIEEALELVETAVPDVDAGDRSACDDAPTGDAAGTGGVDPSVLTSAMSDAVRSLINSNKPIKDAYLGQGKCGKDGNGRPFDTTTSGYDFTFALRLARGGITELKDLACAIANRIDGEARRKGLRYVERTARNALKKSQEQTAAKPDQQIDFTVDRVRTYNSKPKVFELTIRGELLRLTTSQILSRGAFSHAFVDTFRQVPQLPKKGWHQQVNQWLASAELVPMPTDASPDLALREAVEKAIEGLSEGEEATELDQNRAVRTASGVLVFKLETLLHKLQPDWPRLNRTELCVALRDLGYESKPRNLAGVTARAWGKTETPITAREEESSDNATQATE